MALMISPSLRPEMTCIRAGKSARLLHSVSEPLGSQSIIVTSAPAWANSVPKITAAVDFPAPPLGLAITTVGIFHLLSGN